MRILSLLALALFLSACGGDDCTQADWAGSYTGTETCNGDAADITATITASGDTAVVIAYEYTDGSGSIVFDPITIDGCSLMKSSEDDITLTLNADLNDAELTMNSEFQFGAQSSTCVFTLTKI